MGIFEKQTEQIKFLCYDAYKAAEKAHDLLFKEQQGDNDLFHASMLLNKSISYMSAATAIYYSNLAEIENIYIEEVFHTFKVFENEFTTNLITKHSHQWTNIEFGNFKEAYDNSPIKLGI